MNHEVFFEEIKTKAFNKMVEYFNMEYNRANATIARYPEWNTRELIDNAIQRCYGVAEFVITTVGCDAIEVTNCYNSVKELLESLT